MALILIAALLAGDLSHILDAVDMASPRSREAHGVRFTGAGVCTGEYPIGALRLPVSGVRISPGGGVSASLRTGNAPSRRVAVVLTLATRPSEYGKMQSYHVLLDRSESYAASDTDHGGGFSRSLVFEIETAGRTVTVEVLADARSVAPVTVSRIRCYTADRPLSIRDPDSRLRMGLALLDTSGYGYSLDVHAMHEMFALQPQSEYLRPELALVYNFCTRDSLENRNEINRLASMAEETGIPLRIAFQLHWGGIPRGVPDSAEVRFSDPPYQMVTFDPDDGVDDPGLRALLGDRYDVRFGLSVPNIWSDSPWLTFNNERLNRFRRRRLVGALAAWHDARERLRAGGKDGLLPPQLSTGEETVYWAKGVDDRKYTVLNGGKPRRNLMADFNPCVVAEALRDGVTLDPRDGLGMSERWWLHQNMARWQQKIVDWMVDASPPSPVSVTARGPAFADDLVRRNIFTEPYALPLYPMMDSTLFHPGLELGYVHDGRSGGEYWSGAAMLPWLKKERELGRIALPNVECTVVDDSQLVAALRAGYAYGARYTTVYNWHIRTNAAVVLKSFADSIGVPPRLVWPPAAAGGARNGSKSHARQYQGSPSAFGVNRIDLYPAPGAAISGRGRVTIRGIDPGEGESATVAIPPASGDEAPGAVSLFLPTMFHQEPGRRYEVSIGGGGEGEFLLAADGEIALGIFSDLILERTRSLRIEDAQDAEDIIASVRGECSRTGRNRFAAEALHAAERLYAGGRVRESYRAAVRAEQLLIPARFDVASPGGRLSPYPLTVSCPAGPVRAVLVSFGAHSAVLSLSSPVSQDVTVRFGTALRRAGVSAGRPTELVIARKAPVSRVAPAHSAH